MGLKTTININENLLLTKFYSFYKTEGLKIEMYSMKNDKLKMSQNMADRANLDLFVNRRLRISVAILAEISYFARYLI